MFAAGDLGSQGISNEKSASRQRLSVIASALSVLILEPITSGLPVIQPESGTSLPNIWKTRQDYTRFMWPMTWVRRRHSTQELLVLLFSQWKRVTLPVGNPMSQRKRKRDVLQGTLALMVLKTLDVLGPLHGYAIARRIEQISGDLLSVNQGTLYPVLPSLSRRVLSPPNRAPRRTIARRDSIG